MSAEEPSSAPLAIPQPPDQDLRELCALVARIPSEEARAQALLLIERFERREARMRAVLQDQVEPLLRFHAGGRVTFANPAACRFWRKERVELLGRPVQQLLARDGWNALQRASQKLGEDAPQSCIELRAIDGLGRIRWMRWNLHLIHVARAEGLEASGLRNEYQVLASDVTEIRAQHQLLAQHIAERRRAERVQRRERRELEALLRQQRAEITELRRELSAVLPSPPPPGEGA